MTFGTWLGRTAAVTDQRSHRQHIAGGGMNVNGRFDSFAFTVTRKM